MNTGVTAHEHAHAAVGRPLNTLNGVTATHKHAVGPPLVNAQVTMRVKRCDRWLHKRCDRWLHMRCGRWLQKRCDRWLANMEAMSLDA